MSSGESESLRRELMRRKAELRRPEATIKAQVLALVEKEWFDRLRRWIEGKEKEEPGQIPNGLLCKSGKLDVGKRYGVDFMVVSERVYDRLAGFFHGGPKITRPYVLSPGTGSACFILEPLTVAIQYNERTLKKVVDGGWKVGVIKAQLCHSLKLSRAKSRIVSKEGVDVQDGVEIANVGSLSWVLEVDHRDGRLEQRFQVYEDVERHGIIGSSSDISSLSVCVQCLARIPPFVELVMSTGFEELMGSKGLCLKAFRSLISGLLEDGNGPISLNGLLRAFETKLLWDMAMSRNDPCDVLSFMLEAFTDDTARARAGSPLLDIFAAVVHGVYECSNCHDFQDGTSRTLSITLPIPKMMQGKPSLVDCIAAFSIPEATDDAAKMKCKKCRKQVSPMRIMAIDSVGEIVVFQINKWVGVGAFAHFVDTDVEYPVEMDVASFCSRSSGIYRLICAIFMSGTMEKPHYSCACLDQETDQWLYFDDEKVLAVDPSGAHNRDAYLLFYQKTGE